MENKEKMIPLPDEDLERTAGGSVEEEAVPVIKICPTCRQTFTIRPIPYTGTDLSTFNKHMLNCGSSTFPYPQFE